MNAAFSPGATPARCRRFLQVLGESADVLWAPMSYLLIDAMYHDSSPWAGVSNKCGWPLGVFLAFCHEKQHCSAMPQLERSQG